MLAGSDGFQSAELTIADGLHRYSTRVFASDHPTFANATLVKARYTMRMDLSSSTWQSAWDGR